VRGTDHWEDLGANENIIMDLRETLRKDVDWINLLRIGTVVGNLTS
jgi:hypothetical protein